MFSYVTYTEDSPHPPVDFIDVYLWYIDPVSYFYYNKLTLETS